MIIPAEIFVYIRLESQNRSFVRQPYDRVQKQAHLFSKELGLLHLTAVFCPKERKEAESWNVVSVPLKEEQHPRENQVFFHMVHNQDYGKSRNLFLLYLKECE